MSVETITDVLRSLSPSYLVGPVYFGTALEQTGQIILYNSSSALGTTIQAGNTTAAVSYTWPTAGPAGNNYLLGSSTTGVLSWINAPGTYAPIGSAFVTIGTDATLTSERSLTGTANQITVTDNGAGSTVVLSTPQNIHTAATPTFASLTLSASGSLTLGAATNIVLDTGTGTKVGTGTNQKLGFFNKAPVVQPSAYTPTNVNADRSFDADTVLVEELADVVGTLIADLQSLGLVG